MTDSKTIELTPAILRAIAVGIDRLNDGDPEDCQNADEAQKALVAAARLLARNGQCYLAYEATDGYVLGGEEKGTYVFQTASGAWSGDAEVGQTLYLDADCTVPLRDID